MILTNLIQKLRKLAAPPGGTERGIIVSAEGKHIVIVQTSRGCVRALNTVVPPRIGLAVVIEFRPPDWVVTGIDTMVFQQPPQYHLVPPHSEAHIMGHPQGGDDLVFLPKQQYLPLAVVPTSPPSKKVRVCWGTVFTLDRQPLEFLESYFDFTQYIGSLSGPVSIILAVNPELRQLEITEPVGGVLRARQGTVPLAVIRLRQGQTEIRWQDILDIREIPPSGHTLGTSPINFCIGTPVDGEVLKWDETQQCWTNGSILPLTPYILRDGVLTFDSIQEAINASLPGEVVFVPPGDYAESLIIPTEKRLAVHGVGSLGSVRIVGGGTLATVNGQARFSNLRFDWEFQSQPTEPLIIIAQGREPIFTFCEFSLYAGTATTVTFFSLGSGVHLEWCQIISSTVGGTLFFRTGMSDFHGCFIRGTTGSLLKDWTLRNLPFEVNFYRSYFRFSSLEYSGSENLGIYNSLIVPLASPDVRWSSIPVRGNTPGDAVVWDGDSWTVSPCPAGLLADLDDVCISNPAGGQFLGWDPSAQCWRNLKDSLVNLSDVEISVPRQSHFLAWEPLGQVWHNRRPELDDLTGILIMGPRDGEFLGWDSSCECWRNLPVLLANLGDVCISEPSDGDVLAWDSSEECWRNLTVPGGPISLDDLVDVSIGGPVDGEFLGWDSFGQCWRNLKIRLDDLDDVYIFNPGQGQFLGWDSSSQRWCNLAVPAGVGGSGTSGYVPKWTGANTLGNSLIRDSGSGVGIGAAPATGYMLNVGGHYNSALTVNQATYPSINASQTAQTLQSGSHTGTDYTMTTMYVAVKFVASGAHTMGDFTIRIKESADITNRTGSLTGHLYSDDGGSPSKPLAVLATGQSIRFGTLTTSYQTLSLGTQYTLVPGTTYWLVLKWSTAPVGGNIVLDSDVSTNAGATSTDGSVWTNTNVRLRYTIRGRTHYGVYSLSTNQIGVLGSSTNAVGVYGLSTNQTGVRGDSTNYYGVHGTSANVIGVYGSSTNSIGVRGDSTNSYAGFFYRNTAAPSSAVPVFYILQDHASDPNAALRVRQDGTGNILELQGGTTTVAVVGPTGAGGFAGGLYAGSTGAGPSAGDIWATADGRFGGGLFVGSTAVDPPVGNIWAVSDGRFGEGLAVGNVSLDPPTGDIWAITDGRFGGGLYVGSTTVDPPTGNVWATSDGRFAGGLYSGATDVDPGVGNVVYTGVLRSVKNGTAYTGYAFVPIPGGVYGSGWWPRTLSTTPKTKIDVSEVFPGVPDGIKAILLFVTVKDSGSAETFCWFAIGSTSIPAEGPGVSPPPVNDRHGLGTIVQPCDANGDIYYQCLTSGTDTMEVGLQCYGYFV